MPGYAPTSAPRSSMPTTANLPQPRDVAMPDFTSNVYVPFSGDRDRGHHHRRPTCSTRVGAERNALRAPRRLHPGRLPASLACTATPVARINCESSDSTTNALPAPVPIVHLQRHRRRMGWVNDIVPWPFDLGQGLQERRSRTTACGSAAPSPSARGSSTSPASSGACRSSGWRSRSSASRRSAA